MRAVTAMPNILTVEDITKDFGAVRALQGVSFSLAKGEVRALCGENGAGKSTLVKILMGVHRPDSGTIAVNGVVHDIRSPHVAQSLGLALVAQELSLAPHLSVLDNIWLGSGRVPLFHRRAALRRDAKAALATLGVGDYELDRPVGTLSIGQRQIVEIARLIARDARILILDEPTATLSDVEIARIFSALKALKAEGRSVIYITHRLGEVFEICDTVTVLRNGTHIVTQPSSSIGRDTLIELMLGRKLEEMYPALHVGDEGQPPLVVEGLSVPGAVRGFSMVAKNGQILCIAGQLGSGAQQIVRSLAGLVPDARGNVLVSGTPLRLGSVPRGVRRGIFFISEDRAGEGVFLNRSALENLIALQLPKHSRAGILSWRKLRSAGRAQAKRVSVDDTKIGALARELSGGNQQKLLFGRAIDVSSLEGDHSRPAGRSPRILLMNEPTRGVDVGARGEIYRIMREFCERGCAIIMTSSDLEEVVGMADTVITMFRGRKVGQYRGSEISMGTILADITHPQPASSEAA
jgi:ribose transport system ATP-binding protein/rhamnose transport system ATP-binding protein